MKKIFNSTNRYWLLALLLVGIASFTYIFDSKLNLNGDNCYYYANATSLASSNGYSDMLGKPTTNFPPGYPLLMTPLRMVTDSIIAQKIQNGIFLFIGVALLFSIIVRAGFKHSLAFLACSAVLITPHILEFTTMMMSEAACFLCIALVFWLYQRFPLNTKLSFLLRAPGFYIFLLLIVFSYYIRTQAIALIAGFILAFMVMRRWSLAIITAASFAIGYLPWMLRNSMLDLNQSRYITQIDFTNIFSTTKMLLVEAIPESVIPFFAVDYTQPSGMLLWIFAIAVVALIVYGFFKLGNLRWPLFFYFCGTIGIISLFNVPSQYRYLISILPFLTAGLFVGLFSLCETLFLRMVKKTFSPWFLLLLFIPTLSQSGNSPKHTIKELRKIASQPFPPQYQNFFNVGKSLAQKDKNALVCSRKPELLYAVTGLRGVHYLETEDEAALIQNLLDKNVDYVLLEQLGFGSTFRYLFPCVQNNPELFQVAAKSPQPETYMLYFDKQKAKEWLKGKVAK